MYLYRRLSQFQFAHDAGIFCQIALATTESPGFGVNMWLRRQLQQLNVPLAVTPLAARHSQTFDSAVHTVPIIASAGAKTFPKW